MQLHKQPAVIFDRDGTLFSVAHHMEDGDVRSWYDYNGLIAFDAPVPLVAALFHSIRPGVVKIVTSGRMESCRYGMVCAMQKHDLVPDFLFMRRDKDQRRDSIVKAEIYHEKIEPYFDVRYVIDDRPTVVQGWKDLDLPVMAVKDPGVLPRILGGIHAKGNADTNS
jgi:FMN phosphatase YigB (HAD superfamily)